MATEIRADKDQVVEFAAGNDELVRPGTVLYYDPDNESDTCEASATGILRWAVNSGASVSAGDLVGVIEVVGEETGGGSGPDTGGEEEEG
jgi:hypothetical protein